MEPDIAKQSVLKESVDISKDTTKVKGYDFNKGINYDELLQSFKEVGFQATNFGLAAEEIKKMLKERHEELTGEEIDAYEEDEFIKRKHKCTIFIGFTSNIVSSGLRENLRFLVQHNLVDCIVTTAGKSSIPLLTRQNLFETFVF